MNAAVLPDKPSALGLFSASREPLADNSRRLISGLTAAMIVTSLFAMMDRMTSTGDLSLDMSEQTWIRLPIQEIEWKPPQRAEPKPIDKHEPKPAPESEKTVLVDPDSNSAGPIISTTPTRFQGPVVTTGVGGANDGGLLPLVLVQPDYPRTALQRGIEGYVIVQLSVGSDGLVVPGSAQVIEASPMRVFDKAALKAITKFKYKPLIVNGEARPVEGVTYKFSFTLEK